MTKKYNPHKIEEKWQKLWPEHRDSFELTPNDEPYYCLDMFSYPSSEGLHMGHWRPYTIADVWSRYQTMLGKKVLHPVGFDAFGLPAENAAIKNKTHPAEYTEKSIANFTRQLKQTGAMYDWSTLTITCFPEYYKWTQWLFLQLYKHGLAYRKLSPVNWCPHDQTVLANEQVIGGKCERCGSDVIKKELKQWFFKITDFAEDLLDFGTLNWPERIKTLQTNWIGKSQGAEIEFPIKDQKAKINVFTTRPDTLFGVTYLVLAPEHELVNQITHPEQQASVKAYCEQAQRETEIERLAEDRPKTGVFTGAYALHPLTNEAIPIWVADYVIGTYGTGAVMGVPAHDVRDYAFANDYNLPITYVIHPTAGNLDTTRAYIESGKLQASGPFEGLSSFEGGKRIVESLAERGAGGWKTQYRLHDWLVSRQRYWGAPIPILYCEKCGEQPVPESDLPVLLPLDVEFTPTGDSPLARHPSFKHTTCPKCGGQATRETDTLDTFVDSSWYFLRYTSPLNQDQAFEFDQVKRWLPVNFYIGGIEHSTLHLLYARFMMKALHRLGLVPYTEPFQTFFGNGMIYLHGKKMSKSKGNIVNPDDMVKQYGVDALRGYILFMGPADQDVEWQTGGINGIKRFLERSWALLMQTDILDEDSTISLPIQKAYAAINDLLPKWQFNRCMSSLMIAVNELGAQKLHKKEAEILTQLLAPFVPHFAEEIWAQLGHATSVFGSQWPTMEVETESEITYAIQVNGKIKGTVRLMRNSSEEAVIAQARQAVGLEAQTIARTVFVPGRIVSFIVK